MSIKICLDAGHNGNYNQSPVVPAYYESRMNWKLHELLKAELESYGIEVITTRPTLESIVGNGDTKNGLSLRGKTAKGCDLFLSLHSDACNTPSVDRPTAYCSIDGKCNELGQKIADAVHKVMGTTQAGEIRNKNGNGGDYYGVLRGAASVGVPGILMEHSFHTNARSAQWLLDDGNLKKLAEAEARVIAEHFGIMATAPDSSAKAPQTTPESFLVKVTCAALNVRSGAGLHHPVKQVVRKAEVFTIVETAEVAGATWGRLKSGAGWINITVPYCKRV